MVSEEIEVQI